MQALNISKYLLIITALFIYGFLCYRLGKSNAKIEIVEKEKEVIKYETKIKTKEVCSLIAKPNLNDNDIIRLYAEDKL